MLLVTKVGRCFYQVRGLLDHGQTRSSQTVWDFVRDKHLLLPVQTKPVELTASKWD